MLGLRTVSDGATVSECTLVMLDAVRLPVGPEVAVAETSVDLCLLPKRDGPLRPAVVGSQPLVVLGLWLRAVLVADGVLALLRDRVSSPEGVLRVRLTDGLAEAEFEGEEWESDGACRWLWV